MKFPSDLSRFPFLSAQSSLLLASLLLVNCAKDRSPTGSDANPTGGTEISTLFGRITDDSGSSLAGVIVTAGGQADTTDPNGTFFLPQANVPKGRAVIIARKQGYYNGARAEAPGADGTTRMHLRMMKKTTYTVSGSAGGKVVVEGGASIDFPAGGFVTSSGSAFTGTVTVAADYLDPGSDNFYDFFSGDNSASTSDGGSAALVSAGVLRVELQNSSGAALKLGSDKKATLRYPEPADLDAPESMPLWFFDEELGMWKEDGSATLKDGVYEGTVGHFSDWNLDFKGPNGDVIVRIYCDSVPMAGVVARLFQQKGVTDRNGNLRFRNAPSALGAIKLAVESGDNGGRYFINSAINVTVKEDGEVSVEIKLDSPCASSIRGELVDCEDKPVEGMVTASFGEDVEFDFTREAKFLMRVPSGKALTLNANDLPGNKSAPRLVTPLVNGEQRNLGKIGICGGLSELSFFDLKHPTVRPHHEFALSADGKFLAFYGNPRILAIYDLVTRKVSKEIPLDFPPGAGLDWSDDNSRILLGTYLANTARLLDVSQSKVMTNIEGVRWSSLSADGGSVLAVSAETPDQVILYSAEDGSELKTMTPTDLRTKDYPRISWVQGQDAFVYLAFLSDAVFRVWSISGDTLIREIRPGMKSDSVSTFESRFSYTFSGDGERFAISEDWETFHVYDTWSGEKIAHIDPRIHGVTPSPNQNSGMALGRDHAYVVDFIANTKVVLQIALKDSSLVKLHPTPVIPGGHSRSGFPNVSKDESALVADNLDSLRVWLLK